MQIQPAVRFSTTVRADLGALINYLHSKADGYDPSKAGVFHGRVLDYIQTQQDAGRQGVVSVSPGTFGGPTKITPVHDALDRLQSMVERRADYATGIIELTTPHTIAQPVDVDFEYRHFVDSDLNRLPEPFKALVQAMQTAVDAHLIVVIPDPFRPDTLVLVILLGADVNWGKQHQQALYEVLEPATGLQWMVERDPLT